MARIRISGIYHSRLATVLVLCDAIIAVASVVVACKLRFYPNGPWSWAAMSGNEDVRPYLAFALIAPAIRVAAGYVAGIYRLERKSYWLAETLPKLVGAVTLTSAVYILVAFFGVLEIGEISQYRTFTYSRMFFIYEWLISICLVVGSHTFARIVRAELGRQGIAVRRVAVQGVSRYVQALAKESERLKETGYQLVGLISAEPPLAVAGGQPGAVNYLGAPRDVFSVINTYNLNEIIVTTPNELQQPFLDFCDSCHKLDVVVKLVPDLYGLLFQGQPVSEFSGVPVVQVNSVGIGGLSRWVKRIEDIVVSVMLLLVLSPLLALTALAIKLNSPGPVLFRQVRLGKNGRVLRMFKFRSMYKDAEERRLQLGELNQSDGPLFKVKDDPRITRVGRIIRKTSIDELPQLFNVLIGEMSLVGPRPLPATDIANPNEWEARRFAATPGMTGLWQVNRTDHTSEEMLKWDLYYVEHWSLWLDFTVLLKTVVVVLTGRGSY